MNHSTNPFVRMLAVGALLALTLVTGCRREDIRSVTLVLPGLTEANKAQVVEALAKYAGVRKDSYVWDMAGKTLTLEYDSMQVAHTNLRMAIESKGVKVEYPKNTTGRAGY